MPGFLFFNLLPRLGSMSSTSRNFVVAYVFLVGLPLLGLAGVLRSGRHLTAPVSVDGSWKLEASSTVGKTSSCGAVSMLLSAPLLISQSGTNLVVTFGSGKTMVPGSLDKKSLRTSIPDGESGSTCGPAILTAQIDAKSEPRLMNGQLSFLGCQSCAPFEFRGVRQPKMTGGGGH